MRLLWLVLIFISSIKPIERNGFSSNAVEDALQIVTVDFDQEPFNSGDLVFLTCFANKANLPRYITMPIVPGAPLKIKALIVSDNSILVSWKPPVELNSGIEQYTVYVREAGLAESEDINSDTAPKTQNIVPNIKNQSLSFKAKNLDSKLKYEFWVTASTNSGEEQPSKSVVIAPGTRVPAKIASFDETFVTNYKESITLPCLAVGVPESEITWKIKGVTVATSDHIRQQPDGSLVLRDITRTDAGEYSCHVENSFGQDSITHQLVVKSPPLSPQVTVTDTTTSSLTIKLGPNPDDTEPLSGYIIRYKPTFGDWETIQVDSITQQYSLENLYCGTEYQIQVSAFNSIGTCDPSDILNTRTRGNKPENPSADSFIEVLSNKVGLHLSAWSDGGCPLLYFAIEIKQRINTEWTLVGNNIKPGGNFVVSDLAPGVWHQLRVTAHNHAGFNVAEYEFATLTLIEEGPAARTGPNKSAVVNSPPLSPQVTVTDTTTSSLTIKLGPNPDDMEPLSGYIICYKPTFGDWERIQVDSQTQQYILENLYCGTEYQIKISAFNSIGTCDPSDILNTRTRGNKPENPSAVNFIEVLSNKVVLHLSAWSDGGCPLLYFVIELKQRINTEWTQVGNSIKPGGNFVVSDLAPGVWHLLRVTAHNHAGFNVAEYDFATLTLIEE